MLVRLTWIVPAVAVSAAVLLLVAGPGTRLDAWAFGTGFLPMRIAFFAGLGAGLLAIVLLIVPNTRKGRTASFLAAVVIGLPTAWVPWNGYRTAMSLKDRKFYRSLVAGGVEEA